ncbi:MAG: DUF3857 domain-containing protein [Myxococcales bacterium]|nr:DUF3857 domain-containing protein [Myxococcales bacterium]
MCRRPISEAHLLVALCALGAALPAPAARAASGAPDLDAAPPLSVAPADLLAVASASPAPTDADADYLLAATARHCDDAGLCVVERHTIVRLVTDRATSSFATTDVSWKPGYADRPTLRARVVDAHGVAYEADPRTITDQPVQAHDDIYTDLRNLVVPLPHVGPGAIVETWSQVRETKADHASGWFFLTTIGTNNRVRRRVAVVDLPGDRAPTWRVLGPPLPKALEPRVSRAGGRVTIRIDGPPPRRGYWIGSPPSAPSWSVFAVTTTPSWAAAADEYADVIEGVLGAPPDAADGVATDIPALAASIAGDATAPADIIARVHGWMAEHLRYTGIALGDAAWVPVKPSAAIARGYGDCKDLATLFVALLRARGVAADVALVRSNNDLDPRDDLPGLGWFDHAIVHVPGSVAATWVDATDPFSRPGVLSPRLSGRPALVARRGVKALTRLPESSDATFSETREVHLVLDGPARIVEHDEASGSAGGRLRSWWKHLGERDLDAALLAYARDLGTVKRAHGEASGVKPVADPVRIDVTAEGVEEWGLEQGQGSLELRPVGALEALPGTLKATFDDTTPASREWRDSWLARTTPIDLGSTGRSTVTWRVLLPPGVEPAGDIAVPEGFAVGPVKLAVTTTREAHAVTLSYELTITSRELAATDAKALNDALVAFGEAEVPRLTLRPVVDGLAEKGDVGGRLRVAHALHEAAPRELTTLRWLFDAEEAAGFFAATTEVARAMVALAPDDALSQFYLGYALLRDEQGRPYRAGFDPAGAEAALARAVALDPKLAAARRTLVDLLMHATDGSGALAFLPDRVERALALVDPEDAEAVAQHAWLLASRRRWAEVRTLIADAGQGKGLDGLELAAVAGGEGVPAGLASIDGRNLSPAERAKLLHVAAIVSMEFGEPAAAVGLLDAMPAAAQQADLRAVYGRIRDAMAAPAGEGPCAAAIAWWAALGEPDAQELAAALPARYADAIRPWHLGLGMVTQRPRALLAATHGAPKAAQLMRYVLRCTSEPAVGRVTALSLSADLGDGVPTGRAYGVALAGARKGDPPTVFPATSLFLGTEALAALDAKRVGDARALLAVAFAASSAGPARPLMGALGEPEDGSTLAKLGARELGAIAATLAPEGPLAASARTRLEAVSGPDAKSAVTAATSEARVRALLALGAYTEAFAEMDVRDKRGASNTELASLALLHAEQGAAGLEGLVAAARAHGADRLMVDSAELLMARGGPSYGPLRRSLIERYGANTWLGANLRNGEAWDALFDDGADLGAALAVVESIPRRSGGVEHTRAALLAALGHGKEARESLVTSAADGEVGQAAIDVVLGRIALAYGVEPLARWYWTRAKDPAGASSDPSSIGNLAAHWLASLGKKAP